MQRGKWVDMESMEAAVGAERPSMVASEEEYWASGALKDVERWARIGARRSSSSRRGRARAVSCMVISIFSSIILCKAYLERLIEPFRELGND